MTNKPFPVYAFKVLAVCFLLVAGSVVAQAQKTCAEKLATAIQLIDGLKEEIKADEQKSKDQQVAIDKRQQTIEKQQEKIDAQRETITNLDSTIAELKKQIATLEDNVKLSQQNAQLQQSIAQLNAGFIAVQKEAISALAKMGKRSALEKFVDALPSIAGIIAVALTHK